MSEAEIIERPAPAGTTNAAVATTEQKRAAPLTIKETILAQFAAVEPDISALAARYDNVAFDVTTPKGLADAKAARHDLRENGRYFLNRSLEAKKREVNDGKKLLETETERLLAILAPVETGVQQQVEVGEARVAAEKAERDRQAAEAAQAAAQRRERFEGEIAKIRGCVERAKGLPSERISTGIGIVEGMAFGDEWAEYAEPAARAQAETLIAMRTLLAEARAAEHAAAEAERLRAENERLAAAQKLQQQRIAGIQWINGRAAAVQAAIVGTTPMEALGLIADEIESLDTKAVGEAEFGDMAGMADTAKTMSLQVLRSMKCETLVRVEAEASARRLAEANHEDEARAAAEAEAAATPTPGPAPAPIQNSDMVDDMADFAAAQAKPIVETNLMVGVDPVIARGDSVEEAIGQLHYTVRTAPVPLNLAEAPAPAAEVPPMSVGQICTRLSFTVTAAFLEGLGLTPLETKGRAVQFAGSDWPVLKAALIAHVEALQ